MGMNIHLQSVAGGLLKIIGGGAVLASIILAPNLGKVLIPLLRRYDNFSSKKLRRDRVTDALKRLHARRYVKSEVRDGKIYFVVTERGKKRLREFDFESLTLPHEKGQWDKKWRVVIFDIAEDKKKSRTAFQKKLITLGFFQLQKSVLVYPYPCEDEIDFLADFLDIYRSYYFFETSAMGRAEVKLRKHFGLL